MSDDEVLVYDFPSPSWEVSRETAEALKEQGMVEEDGMGGYEVTGDPDAVDAFIRDREE